jgi:hypothetical protein
MPMQMPMPNNKGRALVVTTDNGEYYVIPASALEQFRATSEEQQMIDEKATAEVPGTFASLDADDASAMPSFASESEATALAWFQDLTTSASQTIWPEGKK